MERIVICRSSHFLLLLHEYVHPFFPLMKHLDGFSLPVSILYVPLYGAFTVVNM